MKRLLVFAIIALFSVLMIGAGRESGKTSKLDEGQEQREQLSQVVAEMLSQIPLQHRAEWLKATQDNPEMLLRLNTTNFAFRR